ncbi:MULTISPECIES: sigma-E factor negative regulatory protein [unclassified Herbaspirillum]|uniref:sigma-E factor negative regulatory protein n=1 Tax=unclassified Herbaspirillum TaxID=2624150 RepID=UPI0011533C97|nr:MULTISPECIES: sigma-E factor negative regulatory protein [unclassified Herbaspirillum]MBB5392822.1 sigma-E factor negative regulatory protein RseA [Herbaspirillum sp. SJZ102]TQK04531.1 RseA-like anti sigma(E) protein [Herbaspirillum sp. SJZ130]TQK09684.1 RseA-like anti sigma(E) protein [Herbaspirillum sp. SJZ106]
MDAKVTTREQISTLADGELSSEEMTIALAALRSSQDGREAWEVYHQIGDVLRSEEMDISLSAGFSAKMSALLDAEPAIVAPQASADVTRAVAAVSSVAANGDHQAVRPRGRNRFFLPGAAAAAAVVAAVFVAMPQQAVVTADSGASPVQVAVAPVIVPSALSTVSAGGAAADGAQNVTQLSTLAQQGEVKRDPRIDDYLFAHQRFSPSYSSAQYARSAAFSVGADK